MKLILVSSPDKFKSEVDSVVSLFEQELELFHVRKPGFSEKKLTEYLRMIPKKYHNRVVIHSHFGLLGKFKLHGIHLGKDMRKNTFKNRLKLKWIRLRHSNLSVSTSYHNLMSLLEDHRAFSYVFLSPIFEGISRQSHGGGFKAEQLKKALRTTSHKVIGMGGIDADHIQEIKDIGFFGAAVLGAVWNSGADPEKAFLGIHDAYYHGKAPEQSMKIKPVKIDLKAI